MLKHLKTEDGLLVLDIGPTSSSNVNFLTGLGHSIYMADIVTEASREDWNAPVNDEESEYQAKIASFFDRNMDFSGRIFDVVLLWTTLDYLPEGFLMPLIDRLYASLRPHGKILAFFHTKIEGPESIFFRYHVTDTDSVEMQEAERLTVRQVSTNRKIEKLFSAYETCKFFLAKDNVYEVIITR